MLKLELPDHVKKIANLKRKKIPREMFDSTKEEDIWVFKEDNDDNTDGMQFYVQNIGKTNIHHRQMTRNERRHRNRSITRQLNHKWHDAYEMIVQWERSHTVTLDWSRTTELNDKFAEDKPDATCVLHYKLSRAHEKKLGEGLKLASEEKDEKIRELQDEMMKQKKIVQVLRESLKQKTTQIDLLCKKQAKTTGLSINDIKGFIEKIYTECGSLVATSLLRSLFKAKAIGVSESTELYQKLVQAQQNLFQEGIITETE